jgi:CysZ protein
MFAEGQHKFKSYLQQFFLTLFHYPEAWDFIKKHQIWRGLRSYGWVVRLLIFVAIIFGLHMFSSLADWVRQLSNSENPISFQAGMSSFFDKVAVENFKWAFDGGAKYLILILLEILVFHVTRKTLEIKTGISRDATFNSFLHAEWRMIKVAFFCLVMEKLANIPIAIVTGILPLESVLEPLLKFLVSCFFLGFAILDNYNEIFKLRIRESFKATGPMFGIAMAIGMVTFILMYLPLVGAIAGTILGAVVGTIILEENEELIPEIMAIRAKQEKEVMLNQQQAD